MGIIETENEVLRHQVKELKAKLYDQKKRLISALNTCMIDAKDKAEILKIIEL